MFEVSAEAKERYLKRRQDDLIKCKEAIQNQDLSFLEKVGHQLKGNAVTFGFAELSSVGAQLEIAAKDQNWAQIESLVHDFEEWYVRLSKSV